MSLHAASLSRRPGGQKRALPSDICTPSSFLASQTCNVAAVAVADVQADSARLQGELQAAQQRLQEAAAAQAAALRDIAAAEAHTADARRRLEAAAAVAAAAGGSAGPAGASTLNLNMHA